METIRPVLVTGGAGYIGSHVCKALARSGYSPVTYDDLSTGHEWAVKWGPLERGDILDHPRLVAALQRHRVVAVAHLAARCLAGEGESREPEYRRVNLAGTQTLLSAMHEAGVRQLVHSSTCAVYGQPESVPVTEQARLQPVSVYGRTKLAAEGAIADAAEQQELQAVVLRYFNAAGADPEGEVGEVHDPETHLIPIALEVAAGIRPALQVYGTDYPTADGTCVRDYLHVADIAQAHVLALAAMPAAGTIGTFNLGSARGFSVREIVAACERAAGRPVRCVDSPRRPGDPAAIYASADAAAAALGWHAQHSSIDEIVSTAWHWLCL
jgi:UDP-arabinose 4-epimerase